MMDLPPLRPIPIKDRTSLAFLEKGLLDVIDGAFVLVDKFGVRTQIPVGGIACLMLEPGSRVSHAAVVLAARVGCLLVWVGEAGVRLYSAGQPGGARADRLLYQAQLALDEDARRKVVHKMFSMRFEGSYPSYLSIDQLRGMEGVRVKEIYKRLAQSHGVEWKGRRYNPDDWEEGDHANRCLSAANACLYGISEAAILAAGYAPAIGFLHSGNARSFVYDVADLFKFETVVPAAFAVAAGNPENIEMAVRHRCRDMFRETRLLKRIIPTIDDVLAAGGLTPPGIPADAQPAALQDRKGIGDVGYRN
jgi:CRISPR-associated protein Cas1